MLAACATDNSTPEYKNPKLPIDDRVSDLLGRMTPEEKFRQLFMVSGDLTDTSVYRSGIFGLQVPFPTPAHVDSVQRYFVEKSRLGIPIIVFDEALHGLVRPGATAFPQAIALAATWDSTLMNDVAAAIAEECAARGIRQVLSPVVNLATDARWGRVEETYGEDPVLSASMGVAFVKAFEQRGIITTPKHFVVNHGAGGRDSYPVDMSEPLLEELYLVPFKACIQEASSRSVMSAYNSINGRPASANGWLLNDLLKKQWGFRGFVISDANATGGSIPLHRTTHSYSDAGKQSVERGQDVIFQTDIAHAALYSPPFLDGNIPSAVIDSAVARVLRVKFDLGLFEKPYVNPDLKVSMSDHRALAKDAALKSIVLLKNDGPVLPLPSSIKRIALIGADAVEARLGGYSGPGNEKVSLRDALVNKFGNKAVSFAPGCGRQTIQWRVIGSANLHSEDTQGLTGEYFNNITMEGKPVLTRVDSVVDFRWTLSSPHRDVNYDFFSLRWTGRLQSPVTGSFKLGVEGNDGYRLFVDNKLLIDRWDKTSSAATLVPVALQKDQLYDLKIEYHEPSGNSNFRLVWNVGAGDDGDARIAEAVALARQGDVIIVAAGIEEGEGRDRSHLGLPGRQEEMILRLAATGKPIVVILYGGSPIVMNSWIESVDAVLDAWYPGEVGGEALAEILSGIVPPSGRLPLTFPMTEGQLPLVYNHKPTGRNDDYVDDSGKPLFPFGHGLSYTSFEYSSLLFDRPSIGINESVTATFTIRNTGTVDAEEVAQLYIHDKLASTVRPVKELKAFKRVKLKAGESKKVEFMIQADMLRMLNEQTEWVVEPGEFRIMIGSSSADIRLRGILSVAFNP
jgi:beta-glucosidase